MSNEERPPRKAGFYVESSQIIQWVFLIAIGLVGFFASYTFSTLKEDIQKGIEETRKTADEIRALIDTVARLDIRVQTVESFVAKGDRFTERDGRVIEVKIETIRTQLNEMSTKLSGLPPSQIEENKAAIEKISRELRDLEKIVLQR